MTKLEKLIGQTLDGKYYLDKLLGQGGMGAVFLATHLGTKRPVALKVIAPQFTTNEEVGERFRREAEAAGRLRHPNVVNVTDFGVTVLGTDQLAYLVMEYLDGCSLGELMKEKGKLPLALVVDIVEQICLAIGNAHKLGIIHRDLKPDNIWLQPDGRGSYIVKVLDFGLAKLRDTSSTDETQNPQQINITASSTQVVANSPNTVGAGQTTQAQLAKDDDAETQIQFQSTELEAATQIQLPATTEAEAATLIQLLTELTETEIETLIQPPAITQEEQTRIFDVDEAAATQIQIVKTTLADETATLIQPVEEATQIQLATSSQLSDGEEATQIQPSRLAQMTGNSSPQKSGGVALLSNSQPSAAKSSGASTSGSSAAAGTTIELTRFGSILGTPLYMSPEQCHGDALDARSDIYSLGVMVYQMLAGELPFTGNMMELIAKHTDAPPPQLKEKRADIPNSLATLVMSALAKKPEERPSTAETFATALRATSEDEAEILKQAKSFYFTSQKAFFALSLLIYAPLAVLSIGASIVFDSALSKKSLASLTFYLLLWIAILLATRLNTALCTFAIEELRLMPTAKIKVKEIARNFIRRVPALLFANLLSLLSVILNTLKLLLPGMKKYVDYAFVPSIVGLEKRSGNLALKRSALLVQPLRFVARSFAARDFGIMLASVIAFPFIVSLMAILFGGTRTDAIGAMALPLTRNFVAIYSWFILAIMHTVYAAVPQALLYFKAKQANGEEIEKTALRDWQGEAQKRTDRMGKATLAWLGIPLVMLAFVITSSLVNFGGSLNDSLVQAARGGRAASVKRLLANGADANESRTGRTSALMYAAQNGHLEISKALLAAGAKVNAKNMEGDTALHYAAIFGRAEIAKTLLASAAEVNAQNNEATTPLIAAAQRGYAETVKALLAANADTALKDSKGKTALMYAEEEDHKEIGEMLRAAAANQ